MTRKLALFDMDNTILEGRFIEHAAAALGFGRELRQIWSRHNGEEPFITTQAIAGLFKGIPVSVIADIADGIPVVPDAGEVVAELKQRGYTCGIVTDSYDCVAGHIKAKTGFDFVMANHLEAIDGVATGRVSTPEAFLRREVPLCGHRACKSNALLYAASSYGVSLEQVLAVGDGDNDICMVHSAGLGVAFRSANVALNKAAKLRITQKSFKQILEFAL
jgi:phosphoserine phosphatase SerB